MSNEEIKNVQEVEEKEGSCCFCKAMKKILVIATGTFIGFYLALSLFFGLHKPPMMMHDGHGFKKPGPGFEQGFAQREGQRPERPDFKQKKDFNGERPQMQGEKPQPVKADK